MYRLKLFSMVHIQCFRDYTMMLKIEIVLLRIPHLAGFFSGVRKGLVGAVANPVSGTLEAFSSTFEGIDATKSSLLGRSRPQEAVRHRLPRAIGGDHKLLPFKRPPHGSEQQVTLPHKTTTPLSRFPTHKCCHQYQRIPWQHFEAFYA